MTNRKKRGLGRCDAVKAGMLKALMLRHTPQDVSAWLVGVNGGRANDVAHGRLFKDVPPANDNELRAYLAGSLERFQHTVGTI
jgi:hypothetical protein